MIFLCKHPRVVRINVYSTPKVHVGGVPIDDQILHTISLRPFFPHEQQDQGYPSI